ncbi:MAG: hypothetical protein R2755_27530 [Acidimicrobiales bacterium]
MTQHRPQPAPAGRPDWLATAGGDTEMGERVRTFDWSATPRGPPQGWSAALRSAVTALLNSRFPMLVVWGPELIKIYNDGYRPILGMAKHPAALGAPAQAVWREIWDDIGPLFEQVMATGAPTWTEHGLLMIERNGYPEECYFTWAYSALYDDDGSIGGRARHRHRDHRRGARPAPPGLHRPAARRPGRRRPGDRRVRAGHELPGRAPRRRGGDRPLPAGRWAADPGGLQPP